MGHDVTTISTTTLPDPAGGDFGERSAGDIVYYGNKKAVYCYINDEWRITPTVTLNLGLRYEYTGEPLASNLQSLNSISNVPGLMTFNSPTAQKTNVLPRVGIAWAPTPEIPRLASATPWRTTLSMTTWASCHCRRKCSRPTTRYPGNSV